MKLLLVMMVPLNACLFFWAHGHPISTPSLFVMAFWASLCLASIGWLYRETYRQNLPRLRLTILTSTGLWAASAYSAYQYGLLPSPMPVPYTLLQGIFIVTALLGVGFSSLWLHACHDALTGQANSTTLSPKA